MDPALLLLHHRKLRFGHHDADRVGPFADVPRQSPHGSQWAKNAAGPARDGQAQGGTQGRADQDDGRPADADEKSGHQSTRRLLAGHDPVADRHRTLSVRVGRRGTPPTAIDPRP